MQKVKKLIAGASKRLKEPVSIGICVTENRNGTEAWKRRDQERFLMESLLSCKH